MKKSYFFTAATVFCSCFLLSACNGSGSSSHSTQESTMGYSTQKVVEEVLPLKIMNEGQNSPLNNNGPEVMSFADQQKFAEFWGQNITDKPAPSVDFQKFMVIAVVDENQASGGYRLNVKNVVKKADEVMVNAVRTRPGQNCMNTMVITKPYAIVMVPKVDKPVALSLSMATENCK